MSKFAKRSIHVLLLLATAFPVTAHADNYFARTRLSNVKKAGPPAPAPTWTVGEWTDWSSTCSLTAASQRTRDVACVQGGLRVADSKCDGARPENIETRTITSGCPANWSTGEWSNWSSTCSLTAASTRTRSVTCVQGEATVPDSDCLSQKPAASETQTVYTGCAAQITNPKFMNGLADWSIAGTGSVSTYYSGVNRVNLAAGSTLSQTMQMPLMNGVRYSVTATAQNSNGTAYYGYHQVNVVTASGAAIYSGNLYGSYTMNFSVTGTGEPVTISIKNTGTMYQFYTEFALRPN